MRKYIFILIAVLFISCSTRGGNFKEEATSWGVEYTWTTTDSNGDYIFYTLMQSESEGNTFFIQSDLDIKEHKFKNVKEYKNANIGEIVRTNGKITTITVNNKKYSF